MRAIRFDKQRENLKMTDNPEESVTDTMDSVTSSSDTEMNEKPMAMPAALPTMEDKELPQTSQASPTNETNIGTENDSNMSLRLYFREGHTDWLKTFLLEHIQNGKSGVAYLQGPPGTGKTATINCVMLVPLIRNHYQMIEICCTELFGIGMYEKICKLLKLNPANDDYYEELKWYFSTKPKPVLIVLENLDSLGVARNQMLNHLLTLDSLVIVGIGTTPLLTTELEQWLPLHTITSMQFSPYEKKHILNILNKKLSRNEKVIFQTSALDMLAEKVATSSGDMREAVNMMWLVGKLVRHPNGYSIVYLSDVHDMFHQLRRPSISDISEDLSLHERVILCCVIMILPRYRKETLTFGMVYNIYAKIAMTHGIPSVNIAEAWRLCEILARRKVLRAIPLNNSSFVDWHIRLFGLFGDREKIEGDMKESPLFGQLIEQADAFFAINWRLLLN